MVATISTFIMKVTKFVVVLITTIIFLLLVLLAKLLVVPSTDIHYDPKTNSANSEWLRATDSYDNLVWFLQVGTKLLN